MVVCELMKPSWCPGPNADSIIRATHDVQRELNTDCKLQNLNIIFNLITTASRSNRENKGGPEDWFKPGSCLAKVCELESYVWGSRMREGENRQEATTKEQLEELDCLKA